MAGRGAARRQLGERRQAEPRDVHVRLGVEQLVGDGAHSPRLDRLQVSVPDGVGEQGVPLIAGVDAVDRPQLVERGLAVPHPLLGQHDGVAGGGPVGRGDGGVGRRRCRVSSLSAPMWYWNGKIACTTGALPSRMIRRTSAS